MLEKMKIKKLQDIIRLYKGINEHKLIINGVYNKKYSL